MTDLSRFYDDLAERYDLIYEDWEASMDRRVGESVDGQFDAVIAFDNSIPHLPSDAEIEAAMRGFHRLLRPGGLLLLSVRDYAAVDRSPTSHHPYGERARGDRRLRLAQEWTWMDADHYRTTLVVEEREATEDGSDEEDEPNWREVLRTETRYYAITIERLLELMEAAGFVDCGRSDVEFYQPVLMGRRG